MWLIIISEKTNEVILSSKVLTDLDSMYILQGCMDFKIIFITK